MQTKLSRPIGLHVKISQTKHYRATQKNQSTVVTIIIYFSFFLFFLVYVEQFLLITFLHRRPVHWAIWLLW